MENSQEQNNSVIRTRSRQPIMVARLFVSDFQKEGTLTAELKQTVTTTSKYPTKSVSNDLQDNLFSVEEFGFETKDFLTTNVNVAWIDVPASTSIQEVEARLAKLPNATIQRIISNKPIVHSGQQARLDTSSYDEAMVLINQIANRQVLRFSDSHEETPGQLIFDSYGKPQYKATFFSAEGKDDEDRRTSDPEEFFASPEIFAEMNSSVAHVAGQSV